MCSKYLGHRYLHRIERSRINIVSPYYATTAATVLALLLVDAVVGGSVA